MNRNGGRIVYLMIAIMAVIGPQFSMAQQYSELDDSNRKFQRFLQIVDGKYMDDIDDNELVENAIREVLEQLDPHSTYYTAEELKKANEPLVGNFEGVGIQFNILRDTILVVSTISGGPSEKVGLMSGDKIIKVDGEEVAGVGIKNQGVMERLRGKKGTEVEVEILRKSSKKNLDFIIVRDKIPLYSVDATYMATPDVGYIKINRFAASTADEFRESLGELKAQGMNNLILDLRGNGGGYLNAATEVANELLGEDKLIVYTEGRAYPRQDIYSDQSGSFTDGKLVVLINEGSASASEIVSGAIQDWDRGLVIGRRSFGKGLVQRPFSMPDGSAVRLTVSKYYTPSGRCIQKSYDDGRKEYHSDLSKRLESGELTDAANIDFPDSLKFYTKNNNRVVYGGGGIMPDIFMALDTSFSSDFYQDVIGKGVLNQFVLTYVNKNRDDMTAKYSDVRAFNKSFSVEDTMWDQFLVYAAEEEIEIKEEDLDVSSDRLRSVIKGLLARNLWDSDAYYNVLNTEDPAFKRALQVIEDDTFKKMKIATR